MARRADPSKAGEQLTRGHKKKARTRQQLVETAVRLFAEGVGQELSLTRLAEAAGTSHGTVYNYFRTREEMMEAVGLALAEQFSHEVISFSAGLVSGAERLAVGVRKAQAEPAWGSALVRVVRYDEGLRSALAGYVRADLRAGAEQGDFRYASEELALAMVVAGTTAAVATLLEGYAVEHHDSAVAEMLLLALGLPPDRARATARLPMPTRG
jgi:AcrR family transcriptional regulator